MSKKKAEMAWKKADFIEAGAEIPDRLVHDDIHTEGELMNDDEIQEWLDDTRRVFCLIQEKDPERFEDLYKKYILDIHYLMEIDKIDEEDEEYLLDIKRFEF
jgi:hypothetical protein